MFDPYKPWRSPPTFGTASSMKDHGMLMGKKLSLGSINLLASAASELSGRHLTVPSDILNAFTGICNVLCNDINTTAFWGLPTMHFEHFLFWNIHNSPLKRREGFPSWSWAGWYGKIGWKNAESTVLPYDSRPKLNILQPETWIRWYVREGAWARPLFVPSEGPDSKEVSNTKPKGKITSLLRKKLNSVFSPDLLGERGDHKPSALALQVGDAKLSEQLLHFWTVAASFRLRREENRSQCALLDNSDSDSASEPSIQAEASLVSEEDLAHNSSRSTSIYETYSIDSHSEDCQNEAFIIDKYDRACGTLTFTSATEWPDERLTGPSESPSSHEFILLCGWGPVGFLGGDWGNTESWSMPPPYCIDSWDGSMIGHNGVRAGLRRLKELPPNIAIYRVMLIEWQNGIAYRAGVGIIYKTAIDKAVVDKRWKEIVLG